MFEQIAQFPWGGKFNSPDEVGHYFSGKKIACLICGRDFGSLARHLREAHEIDVDHYRERYGLPWRRSLTCDVTRQNIVKFKKKFTDPKTLKPQTARVGLYRGSYYAIWHENGVVRRRSLHTKNLYEARTALKTFSCDKVNVTVPDRIYFIRCGAFVKIGTSSNPAQRMANMQLSNPYPLTLAGTLDGGADVEARLHERFAKYRHYGEWFKVNGALRNYLTVLYESLNG